MEQKVIEYFNNYFGGMLNESTSQDDLLEAAIQLIELCNLVLDETPILHLSETPKPEETPEEFARRMGHTKRPPVPLSYKEIKAQLAVDNVSASRGISSGDLNNAVSEFLKSRNIPPTNYGKTSKNRGKLERKGQINLFK